ncbi:hypothetical protein [Nocardia stercoris]|uniref:Uncharacterized protein n=1 Tax=Nocardia stercoris TaxID=2483361 RepID=A0A3M2L3G3_9NOCA|nr:hypothetical protein [Nocardia stercoris]RMI30405.1 hypothetical protein EBN03_22480 [Nocardia stercoris]
MNDRIPPAVAGTERDLDLLFDQLDRLHQLVRDDPGLSADSDGLYDFSIMWGVLLSGRLPRLAHYSDQGRLSAAGQARFDELRNRLRKAAPLIARLSLAKPRT